MQCPESLSLRRRVVTRMSPIMAEKIIVCVLRYSKGHSSEKLSSSDILQERS
jgi:hypothetical protein